MYKRYLQWICSEIGWSSLNPLIPSGSFRQKGYGHAREETRLLVSVWIFVKKKSKWQPLKVGIVHTTVWFCFSSSGVGATEQDEREIEVVYERIRI
jgi:hypothetical protein